MKKVICIKADWKMPDGRYASGPEIGDIDSVAKEVTTHECGVNTITAINGYVLDRFPKIVFKTTFFADSENFEADHPELMKDARFNILLTQIFN